MQVELIHYTGKTDPDELYAAKLLIYTKNTRLEQSADAFRQALSLPAAEVHKQLKYIANTIRSSWEFVDFIFQITGVTRAFTHQLVRTRTASYAQQAQRVVDISNVEVDVPATVKGNARREDYWHDAVIAMKYAYAHLKADGVPNQDCRGIMPTAALTNICVKMNLRTLADIVAKRQNLRAQGEYAEVAHRMAACATSAMPWLQDFLYPSDKATPLLDKLLKEALGDRSPIDVPEINGALKELDAIKGTWK
jgi:flavin-dependent thymidylate synthase